MNWCCWEDEHERPCEKQATLKVRGEWFCEEHGLLPNSSDYDRAGLADRILCLASEYRLLGIRPKR
jgi:hypothetical protein